MAGAVSAGAYTAGVVDYLIETLQLWEKAKEKNRALGPEHKEYDPSIPMHSVEIDVMSGASAGGITGTLALLSFLNPKHAAVNTQNPFGENNLFYQSWVPMADDENGSTFEKMLQLTDLKKGQNPESLLNTTAIEEIADKALRVNPQVTYPPYVSKSLDLILTTSNLRGINFKIDFTGDSQSAQILTNHGGFFRYKVKNEVFAPGIPKNEDELYFVLDLNDAANLQYLKDATLSTAAFPIGLKSREIAISGEYIKRYPKYLFGTSKGITPLLDEETNYRFNSIDGGLINNEPFGVGLKILREKNPDVFKKENGNYAVVMIDPFPNVDNSPTPFEEKRDMLSVAKGMFKALRNQVMFNQDGILDALSLSDRTKFLVAPSRKIKSQFGEERAQHHLASSPVSGFAGFLDRSFREHDFRLGRKNCQAFLRYYFAVEVKDAQARLGMQPTQESKNRFGFFADMEAKKQPCFPIIPDIKVLKASEGVFDHENYPEEADLAQLPYPSFVMAEFENKYKKLLIKRMRGLVNGLSGKWYVNAGFRLLFEKKAYKTIKQTLESEMNAAGLGR